MNHRPKVYKHYHILLLRKSHKQCKWVYLEDSNNTNTGLKKAQQNRDVYIKSHLTLVNRESVDDVLMKASSIKSQLLHCHKSAEVTWSVTKTGMSCYTVTSMVTIVAYNIPAIISSKFHFFPLQHK